MVPAINIILTAIWLNCFAAMDMSHAKQMFHVIENGYVTVNTLSRSDVYNALQGNSVAQMDNIISALDKGVSLLPANAYKGALYMKKASLLSIPSQKLATFNQGKDLLEAEISRQNANAELHFHATDDPGKCTGFFKV